MKLPIYLDYAATTPVDPQVVKIMNNFLSISGNFGNPASRSHKFGWIAEEAVDVARNQISDLIKADPREIVFTSGATESNNLALKGFLEFYKSKNHIITSKTEHKSILDTCQYLEKKGFKVTYLTPKKTGMIDLNELDYFISKKTALVSIMYVNNEIGIIQNISKISNICKEKNVILHVDATQAIGKISINLKNTKIDLMSFSAHKIYGPKGIGALYVRKKPRIRLISQIHGGGHERGMRSGTLPVHQIAGFGLACFLAKKDLETNNSHCIKLRNQLWNGIRKIDEVYLNTDLKNSSGHILNVSFNYIEGESLIMALKDLAVSSGSACTSSSLEPSYVLRSIGIKDELAHSSIRFSIGKYTSENEIKYALKLIKSAIEKLRTLSPLWEMYKEGIDVNKVQWNT